MPDCGEANGYVMKHVIRTRLQLIFFSVFSTAIQVPLFS